MVLECKEVCIDRKDLWLKPIYKIHYSNYSQQFIQSKKCQQQKEGGIRAQKVWFILFLSKIGKMDLKMEYYWW